jgi:DNA-binding beta-propeller fold protein YncE
VGVHSAKFPNEAVAESLVEAVARHGITHPVVNDGDFAIWQRYAVRAWPTLVLVDPQGYVVGAVAGEGHGPALREAIQALIAEHRQAGTLRVDGRPFALRNPAPPADGFLAYPGKVLADVASRRLFVANSGHHRIVVADPAAQVRAVAGIGEPGFADGSFATARFRHPQGMALVGEHLYVADTENHAIRRLDLRARTVETVGGTGEQAAGRPRPGTGRAVALNSPWDLVSRNGTLYIAMAGCHQVWAMDLTTGTLTPFAGSGREELRDGPRLEAGLNQPSGLATDGQALFVADSEASAIRVITLGDVGRVTTLVGAGLFEFGDQDGTGAAVRLQHPLGIALLGEACYIADTYNHKIKRLYPALRRVETVFGTGKPGRGEGAQPSFFEPGGLSAAAGRLYIADTNNHRICLADLAAGTVATLPLGESG